MDMAEYRKAAAQYLEAKAAWAKAYTLGLEMRPGESEAEAVNHRIGVLEGIMLDRADTLAELVMQAPE